ncbi:mucin-2 [Calliphora vicina]|uniref:mucin-2 n=1 Tax=Calliphora vicina TaxID=7373 RepID=UPI00325C2AC1
MKLHSKYLISSFIVVACCLQQCCLGQSSTVRPYKFGFTIDEQQHRSEQRDERGIVMGEFGFITADGIYHVTVYATDEQGRFRILAMKNYPYESPPKTVEVMVKPKIPPTTTTTPKPLARHNFNTEACSGCFLTNGNNKPKGINGIDAKTGKSDIRPLSKSLPSPGSNSAANNKSPNNNPATGKISDLNGEHSLLTFKSNEKVIKQNTLLTKSLEFKDFTALKNAVKTQQLFSTKPSTLAPNKVVSTALIMALDKVGSTTSALAHNKIVTTPSTLAPITTPFNLAPKKIVSTTSTLAPNKSITTPSILAPKIVVSTTSTLAPNKAISIPSTHAPHKFAAKEHATGNHVTSTAEDHGNIIVDQNKSVIKTLQIPLQKQISKNIPQHNAPLDKHQFEVVALSTDKNKAIINNALKPMKTKSIQFLKHDLYTPTQTAEQEKTFTQKTPTPKNALQPPIEENSKTDITPFKEQNLKTHTNSQGDNTPVNNLPTETRLISQAVSPETSGKQAAQTPPTTNTLNKQNTPQSTISKDTNQITSKPSAGSPGSVAKTNAGNPPPPIMDIIMQKVLPTLMGKKAPTPSSTPTQSTTLNNKPNAVPSSGKKPSTGNAGKSGGGSSGSSSANGDGDLYRFKYILDYHGHTETGKRNGNKEGSYYAIGDDDVERTIEYVANEFGYQPRIRWRKIDRNEIKSKENTLKDYEFVWFNQ